MEILREYQPKEVNWVLLPGLLTKYESLIPLGELKLGGKIATKLAAVS
jgi:hypothetical protein